MMKKNYIHVSLDTLTTDDLILEIASHNLALTRLENRRMRIKSEVEELKYELKTRYTRYIRNNHDTLELEVETE